MNHAVSTEEAIANAAASVEMEGFTVMVKHKECAGNYSIKKSPKRNISDSSGSR